MKTRYLLSSSKPQDDQIHQQSKDKVLMKKQWPPAVWQLSSMRTTLWGAVHHHNLSSDAGTDAQKRGDCTFQGILKYPVNAVSVITIAPEHTYETYA